MEARRARPREAPISPVPMMVTCATGQPAWRGALRGVRVLVLVGAAGFLVGWLGRRIVLARGVDSGLRRNDGESRDDGGKVG